MTSGPVVVTGNIFHEEHARRADARLEEQTTEYPSTRERLVKARVASVPVDRYL